MDAFSFVFSLFGLLLGLSLTEVLAGFVRTMKARKRVRLGWLTPMLGLFMMLQITNYWADAWSIRDKIPVTVASLFIGLLPTGIYYFAASLVFPEKPEECGDLDDYFFENKRAVFACILATDMISFLVRHTLEHKWAWEDWFSIPLTALLMAWVILAKGKRTNLAILAIFIAVMIGDAAAGLV